MSSRSPEIDLAALRGDGRVVWTQDVLRFSDTDANGHVNNAAFAVFCESGRVHFLRAKLGPVRLAGGYFVIARLVIEFRAELNYPGRIGCATWLAGLGRTSVAFGQALVDERDQVVATSQAVTVAMDGATRRPLALDAAIRAEVEPMIRAG